MKSKLLLTVLLLSSTVLFAAKGSVKTTIQRTFISNPSVFGGCMADIGRRVSAALPELDCDSYWVTFSCSGDFNSKDIAYKMYDSALMSVALGTELLLWIDDSKKHNGHCYAERVDVLVTP